MANATIGNIRGTQTGSFNIVVSFSDDDAVPIVVTDLEKSNFVLTAISGNGVTDVDFSISDTAPSTSFNLGFSLPSRQEGSFRVEMTGTITPQGGTSETITSNRIVVYYDTISTVGSSFGSETFQGVKVTVPLTFIESVIASDNSIFHVEHVSGDDISDIEYYLNGSGTTFELLFVIPLNRKGAFRVFANGDVYKISSGIWDNIAIAPKTVDYDTTVIKIIDTVEPAVINTSSQRAGYDVLVRFNEALPVTGTGTPEASDFDVSPDGISVTSVSAITSFTDDTAVTAGTSEYFKLRISASVGTEGILQVKLVED